jgi:hypothetical protein
MRDVAAIPRPHPQVMTTSDQCAAAQLSNAGRIRRIPQAKINFAAAVSQRRGGEVEFATRFEAAPADASEPAAGLR